jgi:hypothetical protein
MSIEDFEARGGWKGADVVRLYTNIRHESLIEALGWVLDKAGNGTGIVRRFWCLRTRLLSLFGSHMHRRTTHAVVLRGVILVGVNIRSRGIFMFSPRHRHWTW